MEILQFIVNSQMATEGYSILVGMLRQITKMSHDAVI